MEIQYFEQNGKQYLVLNGKKYISPTAAVLDDWRNLVYFDCEKDLPHAIQNKLKSHIAIMKNPHLDILRWYFNKSLTNFCKLDIRNLNQNDVCVVVKEFISKNSAHKVWIFSRKLTPQFMAFIEPIHTELVKKSPICISYIMHPSEETAIAAVSKAAYVIRYIQNPTEAVKIAAAKKSPSIIPSIKNQSEEFQRQIVTTKPRGLKYIKPISEAIDTIIKFSI